MIRKGNSLTNLVRKSFLGKTKYYKWDISLTLVENFDILKLIYSHLNFPQLQRFWILSYFWKSRLQHRVESRSKVSPKSIRFRGIWSNLAKKKNYDIIFWLSYFNVTIFVGDFNFCCFRGNESRDKLWTLKN